MKNTPQHIAIVENDDAAARLLESLLSESNSGSFSTYRVRTLDEAIRLVRERTIDVIVLDLGLPDGTGLGSIKILQRAAPQAAIVVVTSHEEDDDADRAIELGAEFYVLQQEKIGRAMLKTVRHAYLRKQQLLNAEADAHIDPLTGIANRRALDAELQRRAADFTRHAPPFSLVMFDIDWFQKINDQHGHFAGDDALIHLANILKQQTRCTDLVARIGGEEFAVVMPMTCLADAHSLACRIHRTTEAYFQTSDAGIPPVTISGGIAEYLPHEDIVSLIQRTGSALHEAKQRGRNQCVASMGAWFISDTGQTPIDLIHSMRPSTDVRELAGS